VICGICNNRDNCTVLCAKVSNVLYGKHEICAHDMGVFCTVGDPYGLYHPDCDDMVCKYYKTLPRIKKDIQFVKYYKEFSFSNEDIDRLHESIYSMGETIQSGGYTQLVPYQVILGSSATGQLFRKYIQRFLIDNPLDILTHSQSRAIRLYFGLITRQNNSLNDVAVAMRVSKMRIVKHILTALLKIKSFIFYTMVGGMMNGSAHRFEEIGVKIDIAKPMYFNDETYGKIKSVLTTNCSSDILTREQFESLWLFCGCYNGINYTVDEISSILDISRDIVLKRISSGVKRVNKYIIDKILDTREIKICAARDCNSTFEEIYPGKVYCSVGCRDREKERRYRDKKRQDIHDAKTPIKCKGCGVSFVPINREIYHNSRCRAQDLWKKCSHSKKSHVIPNAPRKRIVNAE
jgi:hypothetical protein